jgi:hypothetical protein
MGGCGVGVGAGAVGRGPRDNPHCDGAPVAPGRAALRRAGPSPGDCRTGARAAPAAPALARARAAPAPRAAGFPAPRAAAPLGGGRLRLWRLPRWSTSFTSPPRRAPLCGGRHAGRAAGPATLPPLRTVVYDGKGAPGLMPYRRCCLVACGALLAVQQGGGRRLPRRGGAITGAAAQWRRGGRGPPPWPARRRSLHPMRAAAAPGAPSSCAHARPQSNVRPTPRRPRPAGLWFQGHHGAPARAAPGSLYMGGWGEHRRARRGGGAGREEWGLKAGERHASSGSLEPLGCLEPLRALLASSAIASILALP